jgi:hypothetical protein
VGHVVSFYFNLWVYRPIRIKVTRELEYSTRRSFCVSVRSWAIFPILASLIASGDDNSPLSGLQIQEAIPFMIQWYAMVTGAVVRYSRLHLTALDMRKLRRALRLKSVASSIFLLSCSLSFVTTQLFRVAPTRPGSEYVVQLEYCVSPALSSSRSLTGNKPRRSAGC